MDVKWFFVMVGMIFTFAILSGMYFIGIFVSKQADINTHIQIQQMNSNYGKLVNQSNLQSLQQLDNQEFIITEVKDNLDMYAKQVNTTVNDIKSMLVYLNSTS